MGLHSEGLALGHDAIYQHAFDERFADSCRAHRCWLGNSGEFAGVGAKYNWSTEARFWQKWGASLCRPTEECAGRAAPGSKAPYLWKLWPSEQPDDFFFRSELRIAIMHAMGILSWVWY